METSSFGRITRRALRKRCDVEIFNDILKSNFFCFYSKNSNVEIIWEKTLEKSTHHTLTARRNYVCADRHERLEITLALTEWNNQWRQQMFGEWKNYGLGYGKLVLLTEILKRAEVNVRVKKLSVWEWKNFVKRWWQSHNNEEYCRGIVKGSMKRMQKLARANGKPISSYYSLI